ncbi:MAG: putative rane-associated protein-like protein [Frankiales bacterium]|nr:putative rane-associated protein-like protein [Frankiales bacterium]
MGGFIDSVLTGFPVWALYLVVFLLPFLEASVLLGFVFPGETALVFGGAVGTRNGASLLVLVLLAVSGAITGDAVGYAVGRRYGGALQSSRLGRIVGEERWMVTEAFILKRGGTAVFFGRWTAVLRAMVPGAAGMARLPYHTFFIYNALGGTLWAVACVLGGYLVGEAIGQYVTSFGYVILGLLVVAITVALVHHKRRKPSTSDRSAS